jgi:hypothetical protein
MQGIKGNKITNNMMDEDLTSWRGHRAHNQADPDLAVGIDTTGDTLFENDTHGYFAYRE